MQKAAQPQFDLNGEFMMTTADTTWEWVYDTKAKDAILDEHRAMQNALEVFCCIAHDIRVAWWRIQCLWSAFWCTWQEMGYQRFTVLEVAGLEKQFLWTQHCVILAQIMTLQSVGFVSPELSPHCRRRFCLSIARSLYDLAGA